MLASTIAERRRVALRRQGPTPSSGHAVEVKPAADDTSGSLLDLLEPRLVNKALLIRRVEERLLDLFSQGKIAGTVHTCIGQEFVGVAVAEHLRPGDYLFSNHRGHGHYLAWTDDVEGLIAEVMGRQTGVCGGRGGSQHLCRNGFFSNGIQGGTVPVAGGLALAQQLAGGQGIAAVFVGDGTLGQGVLYETLNMAARWSLPLLIVVEDNGVAQSTPTTDALAGTIEGRAAAFDIECIEAATDDPVELIAAAGEAIRQVRKVRLPVLLHVQTRRLRSHSKGDDTRNADELTALNEADPLNPLLTEDSPTVRRWLDEIDARVEAAVANALAAPETTIAAQAKACGSFPEEKREYDWAPLEFSPQRIADAIRDALTDAMEQNDRIVVLGEDIRDPYGGSFKVTAGLSTRWPDRVLNTPISEAGIVGVGNGLALAGWRPVIEIMFGDFVMLAADQIINHAAKFAWMYNDQVTVPILIRTPMGGYRGYGPTHSQSLEKHLLGLPGTRVIALTHRFCPGLLYRRLLASMDRPTIVIENKLLYGQKSDCTPPAGWQMEIDEASEIVRAGLCEPGVSSVRAGLCEPGGFRLPCTGFTEPGSDKHVKTDTTCLPTIRLRPTEPAQLTLVAYGGMVPLAEAAMRQLRDEEDLVCELLIPTQIYPLAMEPVLDSVARTGRLLIIEEGQGFAGVGSELIAQAVCRGTLPSTARFARVHAAACPIPASKTAEQQILPSVASIVTAGKHLILNGS